MGESSCAEVIRAALRLHGEGHSSSPCAGDATIFVDFENAQPTTNEREVYDLTSALLEQGDAMLTDIMTYGEGASGSIRQAIRSPADAEQQRRTSDTLAEFVIRLKQYHDFSLRLQQIVPLLLWELCSGPLPPMQQLHERQALTKQFAHVLDFTLRFDEVKMCTPAIQNDLSYYRRTMNRDSVAHGAEGEEEVLPFEVANTLSFFYASPTPMLCALRSSCESFVSNELPLSNTTDTLATIANVCRAMCALPATRFSNASTVPFCLRVMTCAIILFDHLHPDGAFVNGSAVHMRPAIRTLQSEYEKTLTYEKEHSVEDTSCTSPLTCDSSQRIQSLLNALRYTSKNACSASTPKTIRALLAV